MGLNWGDLLYLNPITGIPKLGYDLVTGRDFLAPNETPASSLQPQMASDMNDVNQAAKVPGYQAWQDQIQRMIAASQGRQTPFDTAPQAQVRGDQTALAQMLMAQARGEGPSMAQQQLRRGLDQNMSQAMSMAGSVGGRGAGALRQLQMQRAAAGQQMASDSALLRAQEMLQARQLAGQQLSGMRGQDIGLAQYMAQNQLQQQGLNDAQIRAMMNMGIDLSGVQGGRSMQAASLGLQDRYRREDIARDDRLRREAQDAALWGMLAEAALSLAGTAVGGPAGGAVGKAAGGAVRNAAGGAARNAMTKGREPTGYGYDPDKYFGTGW